jgi:hypothetical protein
MLQPKVVLLIFVSGKIVLTGAKVSQVGVRLLGKLLIPTGSRRNIPGFQSHLHRVVRIPKALEARKLAFSITKHPSPSFFLPLAGTLTVGILPLSFSLSVSSQYSNA